MISFILGLISLCSIIGAIILALNGISGWGVFILVGIVTNPIYIKIMKRM